MSVAPPLASCDLVVESDRAWLVRYCARLSPQPESAEDIAQETLIVAWRNRHKLTDPASRRIGLWLGIHLDVLLAPAPSGSAGCPSSVSKLALGNNVDASEKGMATQTVWFYSM